MLQSAPIDSFGC
ncbi:hypothetical protein YPPY64_1627, partial [Yersinia pestis PY-64]